jgi:hypothetical protein
VSERDNFQKQALECMRLAGDCMQLAGDVHTPSVKSHFLRMAGVWTRLAHWAPSVDRVWDDTQADPDQKLN